MTEGDNTSDYLVVIVTGRNREEIEAQALTEARHHFGEGVDLEIVSVRPRPVEGAGASLEDTHAQHPAAEVTIWRSGRED